MQSSQRLTWVLYGIIGTLGIVACCLLALTGGVLLRNTLVQGSDSRSTSDVPADVEPMTEVPIEDAWVDAWGCRDAVADWADEMQPVMEYAGELSDAMLASDADRGLWVTQQVYQELDIIVPPACDPQLVQWQVDFQQVFVAYEEGFLALADGDADTALSIFERANASLTELTTQLEVVVARYQ
jgi:hypothetical protein